MTTADIINCAPWRLDQPRPLTQHEWSVVERAIHDGITTGKLYSSATKQLAVNLTMAVSKQASCPGWTHSSFGPGPAVATYAYGCLGSWFGTLDAATQGKALADISTAGLLCSASVPWAACPRAQHDKLYRRANHSEYSAQIGDIPAGVVPPGRCVLPRQLIAYTPMTGQQMVQLVQQLNHGSLPPELQQLLQLGGALFIDRSFLVGWQLKPGAQLPGFTGLASVQDLLKLADAMVEDVALVWAPGQGASIRRLVMSAGLDPAALVQLLQQLLPDLLGNVLSDWPTWLQQQLPGLLQTLPPATDIGGLIASILGTLGGGGTPPQLAADPTTPPTTGLYVVDAPAMAQDPEPPPGFEPHEKGEVPGWLWFSGAAVVGYAGTSFIRRLVKG